MIFTFEGQERLCLWFSSPNQCGAAIVLVMLLLAYLLWRFPLCVCRFGRLLLLVGTILELVLGILLLQTYCRGAYVAFAVSWTLMAIPTMFFLKSFPLSDIDRRKYNLWRIFHSLILLSFFVALFVMPHTASRVQSITGLREASILNRLYLWRGGLILLWQNCWSGAGTTAAECYSLWLQPLEIQENYYTFISDLVTLGAFYGIFAVLLYSLIYVSSFGLGFLLWRVKKNPAYLYIGGLFFAAMLCGIFNSGYNQPFTVAILLVGAILLATESYRFRHELIGHWRSLGITTIAFSGIIGLVMLTCGWCFHSGCQWLINESSEIPRQTANGFDMLNVRPKQKSATCRILLMTADIECRIRSLALPLAASGCDVTLIRLQGEYEELPAVAAWGTQWLAVSCGVPSWWVADSPNVSNLVYAAVGKLSESKQLVGIVLFDVIKQHPFSPLAIENKFSSTTPCILYSCDILDLEEERNCILAAIDNLLPQTELRIDEKHP